VSPFGGGGGTEGRGGFTPPLNDKKIHKATWAQIFITYVIVPDNTIKTHLLKNKLLLVTLESLDIEIKSMYLSLF
jgi:hypothetical protein